MAGWALSVSIASLVVAIGAVVLTWYLWRWSGPELVVLISKDGGAWRGIEVVNSGRMPVVIREVGVVVLEDEHDRGRWGRVRTEEHRLGQPEDYPATIPPTGYFPARRHGGTPVRPRGGRQEASVGICRPRRRAAVLSRGDVLDDG